MVKEQLTIKEAIEQGYTKYGFADKEWQTTEDLHDGIFEEVEEEDHGSLVLFEKKSQFTSITEETVSELISEHLCYEDSEECGRDNDSVSEALSSINYSEIVKTINSKMKERSYWMLTDIQIVKNI